MNTDTQQLSLKEIVKKEYIKCSIDPEYFLKKYCYIQIPGKPRQLFSLYDYQTENKINYLKSNSEF